MYSVGATLASGIGLLDIAGQNAVKGIKEAITGEYAGPINYSSAAMNPNTIATSIRSTRAQNIANKYGVIDINPEDHPFWAKILNGKSFGDVYQLGMSMADSAAVLAMSPILGSYGTVLLGGSAGTQGVITALENGATDEQALAMGVLNGFFEMFFEKYSLETLLSSNGRRFIDALWRQAVAEGSEELFTSAANNVADIIVMAEKSGYMKNVADYIDNGLSESESMQKALLDMGIDMGWDFVGGLISGGIMGGGGKVATNSVQQLQNYKTGKNILSTDGGVDALLNSADQVRSVSSPQMQNALTSQIDKVNKKPTARNVGQLNATVQAANSRVNASVTPEDVTNMLKSKRVDTKTATGITDAIVASLNGQELTRTQSQRLSSALDSPTVQSVISELMKKKSNGIDSTLKNAYDEINTIGGNKNGQEATLWHLSNQRADGSLQSLQTQTRAEDGNGSGVPGTLREIGGLPAEALSATQRRGLTSETDAFGDNDYATLTEGSALHKVQSTFFEEYGIECYVIKDTSWTRSSPAYSRNGIVYIREGIDAETLATAVPHEATHIMKQQSFQPYIDFISCTPDALNFQSATIERLLNIVAKHKNINPFTANDYELFNFYDELNSIVYGLYKSGALDTKGYDFREAIPGAFHDFTSYIQEMDQIHEQFRNRRNTSAQTKAADGRVDALMKLANEVTGVSSAQMQSTLTSQMDKVSKKPTARNVGQLNATVQAANIQADVAKRLMDKGLNPEKAATMADAIAARLNGQELTRIQTDRMRAATDSAVVRDVISDITQKKAAGVDSAQSRIHDGTNNVPNEISQNPAARNVGQLDAIVQAANNQANASVNQISIVGNPGNTATNQANTVALQEEVAKSLRNKGINSQKATGLAGAILARLNGRESTRSQRSLLNIELGSPTVQSVIADITKNSKSTVGQHNLKRRNHEFEKTAGLPEKTGLVQEYGKAVKTAVKTPREKYEITDKTKIDAGQSQKTLVKSLNRGTIKLGLTDTDTKGIYDYMSSKSYIVNEKLRAGLPLTDEDRTFVNNLDVALRKMPTYQGDLKRSLIFETDEDVQAFIRMYAEGKVMKYDQYISTTQGGIYNSDGQVQILIRNTKRGKDISILNPNETEVLYERGMTFKVISVRKVGSKYFLLMEESDE